MIQRLLTLWLLSCLLFLARESSPVSAQATADYTCITLVIDDSGSMAQNDPTFLRNTGAKLFIALLDDGDRVGVVRFNSQANAMTPALVTLDNQQDKTALLNSLTDTPPEGYTDMRAALASARELLETGTCQTRYVVLLSDGYPQLADGLPADYISDMLELARQMNAPIYGIALTEAGESGVLYELARATDPPGVVIPARTATDLLDAYLDVVARLKDRTVVGHGSAAAPGVVDLPLDASLAPYVNRITFIVSQTDGVQAELYDPVGGLMGAGHPQVIFSATNDARFSVITVDNPPPGVYQFNLKGSGRAQTRAILRSRLRVATDMPLYHAQGQPLLMTAQLVEAQANGEVATLIGQASFSADIIRPDGSRDTLDQLYDTGQLGDMVANDGIFTNTYVKTDLAGEYLITLTGYKGITPTSRTIRLVIAPFPQIEIVQPAGPAFDFRVQPLELYMRLAGGEPATLDSGSFAAQVTEPDGREEIVLLTPTADGFVGTYTPQQTGSHHIVFVPQTAWYKGSPYTLSAETRIAIRIIPSISPQIGMLDLGVVEIQPLGNGLVAELPLLSSSPQLESLEVELVGLPGIVVQTISPANIPTGTSTLFITLQGNVTPGSYSGVLVLSSREGIDLIPREVSLHFDAYQPTLMVTPATLTLAPQRSDRLEEATVVALTITSASQQSESITLIWEGPEGTELVGAPVEIASPGETITLTWALAARDLPPGQYTGQLRVVGRDGLIVEPTDIPVSLSIVAPTWCQRFCTMAGAGGLGLATLAIVSLGHLRSRPRPWGALQPVKGPSGQPLPGLLTIQSGFFKPGQAIVGSGRGVNVRVLNGQVLPKHAAIIVDKQQVTERIGRPPKSVTVEKMVMVVRNINSGTVRVNGVMVPPGQQSVALKSGMPIVIGDYEFRYSE